MMNTDMHSTGTHPLTKRAPALLLAIVLATGLLPRLAFPADASDYGRVFFTPGDRTLLDAARRHKERVLPKPVAPKRVKAAAPPPPPERPSGNVTLNGIVRRSDGEATIWVNGVAMPADAQTGKVTVAPTSSQSGVIHVPNGADSVELKVGQKLDLSSGNVTERYVNRSAPRATGTVRGTTPSRTQRAPSE